MTATEPLPDDQRLKDISPKAYEHPADRAATAALQSIPMLDTVVRALEGMNPQYPAADFDPKKIVIE